MTKRRLQWAITTPEGKPLLIDGVIAAVDDDSGTVTLDQRVQDVIAEVLANDPVPSRSYLVPGIDLAHEVHRLIQEKHQAGIPVHSPLPPQRSVSPAALQAKKMLLTPYDEVIIAILAAVHSQMQFLRANLIGEAHEPVIDAEDLRHGRLGYSLYRLARMAMADEQASSQEYFELVDYVDQFINTMLSKEDRTLFDEMVQKARPHAALV